MPLICMHCGQGLGATVVNVDGMRYHMNCWAKIITDEVYELKNHLSSYDTAYEEGLEDNMETRCEYCLGVLRGKRDIETSNYLHSSDGRPVHTSCLAKQLSSDLKAIREHLAFEEGREKKKEPVVGANNEVTLSHQVWTDTLETLERVRKENVTYVTEHNSMALELKKVAYERDLLKKKLNDALDALGG